MNSRKVGEWKSLVYLIEMHLVIAAMRAVFPGGERGGWLHNGNIDPDLPVPGACAMGALRTSIFHSSIYGGLT